MNKSRRAYHFSVLMLSLLTCAGCGEGQETTGEVSDGPSIIRIGNAENADVNLEGPMLYLMGKGTPDGDAFGQFLVELSPEGLADVTVIAASFASGPSSTPECDVFTELPGVNSCTTVTIRSIEEANDPAAAAVVANSDVVYFAGGNQCNYMDWRDTGLMEAVKGVFKNGGGVGGGSAGLAIQGEWVYDGCTGSILSEEALENPFDSYMSLSNGAFSWPFMTGWITDSHFSERDRLGRLIAFQARIMEAEQTDLWLGLGMDDDSAIVVNSSGMATVYGADSYIVKTTQPAEMLVENSPLTIDAVEVYKLPPGTQFQIDNFEPSDEPEIYSVEDGVLKVE